MAEIQVSASSDRLTQRQQIEGVLARAAERGEPARIRLPFTMYEYDEGRTYLTLRDATWNLNFPIDDRTAETVEHLVSAMDAFVRALGELGADAVMERLRV